MVTPNGQHHLPTKRPKNPIYYWYGCIELEGAFQTTPQSDI